MAGKGEERRMVGCGCVDECRHDRALVVCELGDESVFPFPVREGYRVSYVSLAVLSTCLFAYGTETVARGSQSLALHASLSRKSHYSCQTMFPLPPKYQLQPKLETNRAKADVLFLHRLFVCVDLLERHGEQSLMRSLDIDYRMSLRQTRPTNLFGSDACLMVVHHQHLMYLYDRCN